MAQTISSFEELSLEGLRDIYDAEQKVLAAFPEMIEAASSNELKTAFREHREQTQEQVKRLETIFKKMGEEAKGKECPAARGLIAEAKQHIKEVERGPLLDAALIGAAQRFEHYEISAYGTARAFARRMGDEEAAKLLDTTLDEESQTDEKLNRIAEKVINPKAARA
ncbi:MAG TPA: ferritin-like domain-containing protein [Armatimonadaceae bacterium]|jgi:ferritin-like metal-binding protein YciE|nr:ferritin-like domain-containing protein [Armatimonadaceae bacterium]